MILGYLQEMPLLSWWGLWALLTAGLALFQVKHPHLEGTWSDRYSGNLFGFSLVLLVLYSAGKLFWLLTLLLGLGD